MASLVEIQRLVEQIKADLPLLVQRSQITPKQVVIANGLSDMSERLGLIQAGEFRSGNGLEPGFGFSGTRMGYPAFSYADETWNLVGINNDILQVGIRAADGKLLVGGGAIVMGEDGIFVNDAGDAITFYDDVLQQYSSISMQTSLSGTSSALRLMSFRVSSETNQISNGDFETGDFTSWTETDADGVLSVVAEGQDGGYCAKFDKSAAPGAFASLEQNLAATATNGVVVTFKAKSTGGTSSIIAENDSFEIKDLTIGESTGWVSYILAFASSTADLSIAPDSNGILLLDDIVIRPLTADGGGGHVEVTPTHLVARSHGLKVSSADDSTDYFEVTNHIDMGTSWGLNAKLEIDLGSTTTNNLNDAGIDQSNLIELTSSANVELGGINHGTVTPHDGRLLTLHNTGSFTITLVHEKAGATAANRFDLGGNNLHLVPDGICVVMYSTTASRWKVVSGNKAGDLWGTFLALTQVPASSSYYSTMYKPLADGTTHNFAAPADGVVSNLALRLASPQPATGSMDVVFVLQNIDTALAVTVPASGGAGSYTNDTDIVEVSKGNVIRFRFGNNATSASGQLSTIGVLFTPK